MSITASSNDPCVWADRLKSLKRHLHFDFEVDVCLRELGHGWNSFTFGNPAPEKRLNADSGALLPPESFSFCVSCDPMDIGHGVNQGWPTHKTIILRDLVAKICEDVSTSLRNMLVVADLMFAE